MSNNSRTPFVLASIAHCTNGIHKESEQKMQTKQMNIKKNKRKCDETILSTRVMNGTNQVTKFNPMKMKTMNYDPKLNNKVCF